MQHIVRFHFLFTLAFVLVAVPLALPLSGCKPRPTSASLRRYESLDTLLTTKPAPRLVGKVGTLVGFTAKDGQVQPNVGFAPRWEDFDDFANASLARNYDKIREMAAAGKILGAPSGEVQAVFLESRATRGAEPVQTIHIKMLSGQYKNQTAWIYAPSFRVTQ